MKCQILFKGQIKTNVSNLSTAELAERVVRIKISKKKNLKNAKTVSTHTCTLSRQKEDVKCEIMYL